MQLTEFNIFPGKAHICFLLLLAFIFIGCAQKDISTSPQVNWDLSPEAKADFFYLRYQGLLQENKPDKALESLKKVIAIQPSAQLYLDLANLQWQNNNLEEARETLKKGRTKFPDSPQLAISLANTYLAQNRRKSALVTLKKFLDNHKEDQAAQKKLASIYLDNQQFAQALDILNQIPEDRESKQILFLKAKAYTGLGLQNKAIRHLKQATDKDPDFIEAWAELAYLYEVEKDYVSAAKTYSRLLEMGQTSPEVWIRLIDIHLKLNNPDKALQLVKDGPQNEQFLLRVSGLFLQESFYTQAEEVFSLFETKPAALDRYYFYLSVLAYEGQDSPEKALEHLQKIKPDSDIYPKSLTLQARILLQIGQDQKAQELVRKGQQRFPENKEFWLIESSLLETQNDYQKAQKTLEQALEHIPEDQDLLYHLALMEHKLGNEQEALQTMEKVININPEHSQALNFVGYTLADSNQNLERALVLVKKALELDPENGFILDSLAWVYFKQGKVKKAWETIGLAISKVQNDPIIWEHYGDIARKADFLQKAKKGYQKAIELGAQNSEAIRQKLRSLPQADPDTENS
jgi:tetratricopeptide (TPR) repeat protein